MPSDFAIEQARKASFDDDHPDPVVAVAELLDRYIDALRFCGECKCHRATGERHHGYVRVVWPLLPDTQVVPAEERPPCA